MAIQWFPGHMYKAKKIIQQRLKSIDLIIEVLDARLPGSSMNPLVEQFSKNKLQLKLLNKADLADDVVTKEWIDFFNSKPDTVALAVVSNHTKNENIILKCRELAPHRKGMDKPLRIMVCGIPNVGKSSFINHLLGKKIAKTGNEAGITKDEQRLVLAHDIWLYDTPGMLWEKIIAPEIGYRLAIAGSVGRKAYDDEEVILHILEYLKNFYLQELIERYHLEFEDQLMSKSSLDWLVLLARKRGAVGSGNRVDYQKIAEIIIQDFRTGRLGKISLERPNEWQLWWADGFENEQKQKQIKEKRKQFKSKNKNI